MGNFRPKWEAKWASFGKQMGNLVKQLGNLVKQLGNFLNPVLVKFSVSPLYTFNFNPGFHH